MHHSRWLAATSHCFINTSIIFAPIRREKLVVKNTRVDEETQIKKKRNSNKLTKTESESEIKTENLINHKKNININNNNNNNNNWHEEEIFQFAAPVAHTAYTLPRGNTLVREKIKKSYDRNKNFKISKGVSNNYGKIEEKSFTMSSSSFSTTTPMKYNNSMNTEKNSRFSVQKSTNDISSNKVPTSSEKNEVKPSRLSNLRIISDLKRLIILMPWTEIIGKNVKINSNPKGKKRLRQSEDNNENNYINVEYSQLQATLFRFSMEKLIKCLICPPCRLHNAYSFNKDISDSLSTLQYAVIPNFFNSQSLTVKRNSRDLCELTCKSPLRQILIKSLTVTRDAMGAVDEISKDSLLIVAFAEEKEKEEISSLHSEEKNRLKLNKRKRGNDMMMIVGLCVARELTQAYRLHSTEEEEKKNTDNIINEVNNNNNNNNNNNPRWEEKITEVGDIWCVGSSLCGIQFVWVKETHRRSGIANILLELSRKNVSYGFEVPKQYVAFSEPTTQGKLFARSYTGRSDFLIF